MDARHLLEVFLDLRLEAVQPAEVDDPFYSETDYVHEFFTVVQRFNQRIMEDPCYGALLGGFLASAVGIVGARHLGRNAFVSRMPARIKRWEARLSERGFWAVFYMRLTPAIPYNLVNYGAGLTSLKARSMAAGWSVRGEPAYLPASSTVAVTKSGVARSNMRP